MSASSPPTSAVENPIQISVNGEPRVVSTGTTISVLLRDLQAQPRYVAVEQNCRLVPRTRHEVTTLSEGDRIEIVTLVGGG